MQNISRTNDDAATIQTMVAAGMGIGISQRKDGLYTGRVTDPRTGKRIQKYFHKLQECRKWVADTQYEFAHGNVVYSENPTFKVWFFTGWNL